MAELAREIGVTPSLISQIERGQSRPSVSTLFALAQALDVPVDAFFPKPAAGPAAAGALAERVLAAGGAGAAGAQAAGPGPLAPAGPRRAPAAGRYVVRRGNRAALDIDGGVRWERLTPETLSHLDFFELVTPPVRNPTRRSTRIPAPRWCWC